MSLSKVLRSSLFNLSKEKYILARKCSAALPVTWLNKVSQESRYDWPWTRRTRIMVAAAVVLGVNLYLYLENQPDQFRLGSQSNGFTRNQLHAKEVNDFKNDVSLNFSTTGTVGLLDKECFVLLNKRAIVITSRQRLFFQFASIEFEGIPYMTPQDFIESVTEDHPRRKITK